MEAGGCFPGGKVAEAWSWQLTSYLVPSLRMVELHLHCRTRIYGAVFKELNIGIHLPYFYSSYIHSLLEINSTNIGQSDITLKFEISLCSSVQ
jgi:hypothetical protein